jgi:hypothetical protein
MVSFNRLLRDPQLLLHNLRLDPQIRELITQPLVLNSQRLALLLANLDLFLQQHRALNRNIVLGLKVLQ